MYLSEGGDTDFCVKLSWVLALVWVSVSVWIVDSPVELVFFASWIVCESLSATSSLTEWSPVSWSSIIDGTFKFKFITSGLKLSAVTCCSLMCAAYEDEGVSWEILLSDCKSEARNRDVRFVSFSGFYWFAICCAHWLSSSCGMLSDRLIFDWGSIEFCRFWGKTNIFVLYMIIITTPTKFFNCKTSSFIPYAYRSLSKELKNSIKI